MSAERFSNCAPCNAAPPRQLLRPTWLRGRRQFVSSLAETVVNPSDTPLPPMGVVFGYKVRWVDVGYPRRTTLAAREMSYGDLVTAADWPANSGINAQRCVWVLTVDASRSISRSGSVARSLCPLLAGPRRPRDNPRSTHSVARSS